MPIRQIDPGDKLRIWRGSGPHYVGYSWATSRFFFLHTDNMIATAQINFFFQVYYDIECMESLTISSRQRYFFFPQSLSDGC